MQPKDYADTEAPLVVGSLIGARVFAMQSATLDPDRVVLSGPIYSQFWDQGENIAVCRKRDSSYYYYYSTPFFPSSASNPAFGKFPNCTCGICNTSNVVYPPPPPPEPRVKHTPGTLACECGFYAFNSLELEPKLINQLGERAVLGIIEGYGRISLGSKGFKCEKAKILAIAPISMIRPIEDYYYYSFLSGGKIVSPYDTIRYFDPASQSYKTIDANNRPLTKTSSEWLKQLQIGYPEIKIYADQSQAIADYPLTKPEDYPKAAE